MQPQLGNLGNQSVQSHLLVSGDVEDREAWVEKLSWRGRSTPDRKGRIQSDNPEMVQEAEESTK